LPVAEAVYCILRDKHGYPTAYKTETQDNSFHII